VLKSLEGQQGRGSDIARFLEEQSMTKEAKAAAKADVLDAEARLARAELLRAETLADPALRKAARKQAIANLIDRLTLRGVFEDPTVREAAKSGDLARIAGALGEALQRAELAKDYPAAQGYRVIANLAIARVVPGFKTIAEWKAAEAKAGRPDAKTAKLVEHDGKLWELQGEADSVVVEPSPTKGKVRPVAIEEVKTGAADSPTDAMAQIAKAIKALELIQAGDANVRAFENSGGQKFGNDVSDTLDLSGIDSVTRQTRGPAGKGHTASFPYEADVLRAVAESIVQNGLPPAKAKTAVPPTSPEREEQQEPAGAAR
jgi:hypothetical protein